MISWWSQSDELAFCPVMENCGVVSFFLSHSAVYQTIVLKRELSHKEKL